MVALVVIILASLYNKDRNIVGGAILMLLSCVILLALFLISVYNR